MKTYVLYIPGLGDGYDGLRRTGLRTWKLWGVQATLVPMTWYDGDSVQSKMARIQAAIDAVPDDRRLVLFGESAGASLALLASVDNKRVERVVTVCGVARPDTPVSSHIRRGAPALDQALQRLPERFDVDVHSVRAVFDGVIGKRYSIVQGSTSHVIWSVGHFTTITLCLTLFGPIISAIAKNQK